jgi:hypothetical protein
MLEMSLTVDFGSPQPRNIHEAMIWYAERTVQRWSRALFSESSPGNGRFANPVRLILGRK